MMELLKYFHNIYKTESPLVRDSNRTWGHSLKLNKWYPGWTYNTTFSDLGVVDLWNDLPECVVTAEAVNSFKSRPDAHWSSIRCILEPVTVAAIHHI